MPRRLAGTGPAAALLALLAGLVAPRAGALPPGDHDRDLAFGGRERHYRLHVPPGAPERGPLPLLLAFHGGGGNGRGFQAYAGLDAVADAEGFAVVYPDGSGLLGRRLLTWNAGGCCGYAMREKVDDVGFALAVIDAVAREQAIDARRVYATGHSNGAMLAQRLGAEAADRIAAIASVAGATELPRFAPSRPLPVLMIHSVDDPRALYRGGLGPPFPWTRQRSLHADVEATLERWARHDGCPETPREAGRRSQDGQGAALLVRAPCREGTEVALWRLTGVGHGWPGHETPLPERILGPRTRILDAAAEVWRFVSRFSLPEVPGVQRPAGSGR